MRRRNWYTKRAPIPVDPEKYGRKRDRRLNELAVADQPSNVVKLILDDPELKTLAAQINEHHEESLAGYRTVIDHALQVGELLAKVKARVGHGNFRRWIRDNCKFSVETAKRYHRLYRRLGEMPHLREQIMEMDIVEADKELEKECKAQVRRAKADPEYIHSAFDDLLDQMIDVISIAKAMIGDEAWDHWNGDDAVFVKGLFDPPRPVSFPFKDAPKDEDDDTDVNEQENEEELDEEVVLT